MKISFKIHQCFQEKLFNVQTKYKNKDFIKKKKKFISSTSAFNSSLNNFKITITVISFK